MKRKATLFATLLTGLLVASAVQASPFMLFDQLFGMGAPDVTTQGNGYGEYYGRQYGPNYGPQGPKGGSADVTALDSPAERPGQGEMRAEPGTGGLVTPPGRGEMNQNIPW